MPGARMAASRPAQRIRAHGLQVPVLGFNAPLLSIFDNSMECPSHVAGIESCAQTDGQAIYWDDPGPADRQPYKHDNLASDCQYRDRPEGRTTRASLV